MHDYQLWIPETQVRQLRRSYRTARAAWRSLRVIWREFRTPIVVFLVAVFLGGWLYAQVWNSLPEYGDNEKYYIDMPYYMVALMIFAAPDDIPTDARLVVFWYVMPLIGAYVAGRGVFDFVNLFFIDSEHRKSWEEALASTYKNHVIVLGVGHLGTRVLRQLVVMGFDVVAIDLNPEPDKTRELKQLGVPLVVGDGRLTATLDTAGVRHAQALLVCTSNDQMNIEVTLRAHKLNPQISIVVRMWDDMFASELRESLGARAVLSTTNLAAPSFAAAALGIEITQTMTINGERYSMIQLTVALGSQLANQTIGALQSDEDIDIVLHGRRGRTDNGECIEDDDDQMCVDVHPANDITVLPGDTLVLFAHHSKINRIVQHNRGQRMTSV